MIHCYAGLNRSGSVVAYILYQEALRSGRKQPIDAIIAQLRQSTRGYAIANTAFEDQLMKM